MPFHLAPVSRRRFLASSLAAGLGVLSWRPARGEERAKGADHWILLADTHIAANRDAVNRGVKMADNLQRVVAAVTALEPRPAGLVLNGDLALQKGESGDYRLFAELLRPLSDAHVPVHLTLGNHDDRDNFRKGVARAARSPLGSRHVSIVETARANWFLLDSLDKVAKTPGTLGEEQLKWLGKALDAHASKPALVVVHHDPQWKPVEKRSGLVDTERLFAELTPRKQVKALIFGHTHNWHRDKKDGIHLINLPPVAYVFQKDAPNGWVDVRLRDGGAVLKLHALDPKHKQNGETLELAWR
ncbi:MAG TPA: metallophosphoesterase [Gemmataceae bacterium]